METKQKQTHEPTSTILVDVLHEGERSYPIRMALNPLTVVPVSDRLTDIRNVVESERS